MPATARSRLFVCVIFPGLLVAAYPRIARHKRRIGNGNGKANVPVFPEHKFDFQKACMGSFPATRL